MAMNKTIQLGYVPLRVDVIDITTADTTLTYGTAGATFGEHDRPSGAFALGEDCNACEIIVYATDATNNKGTVMNLWGYATSGPAEFLCDVSMLTGQAVRNDSATTLYMDTMVIGTQAHIKTISPSDSGNDRVAKLAFDVCGLKYIYASMAADTSSPITPLIRTF